MKRYSVKEEDTLHKVAFENKIYVKDILDANPQISTEYDYLVPGEKLILPTNLVGEKRVEKLGECAKEFSHRDVESYIKQWSSMRGNYSFQVSVIGYSVLEKPLYLLKLGRGAKKVFYSGGWHANEWLTSKFLCDWVNHLLIESEKNGGYFYDVDLNDLFDDVTLYLVPMVNPDGITLVQQGNHPNHPYHDFINKTNKGGHTFDHWSSNIRGVDLNHQWPAGWKKEADESPREPWPRHYSGTAPLTEPEARAVYTLTKDNNFSYVLAFHSQGQLIYWGYRGLEPKVSLEMVERLSLKSSYVPVRTADSDGGYKDWFIQETGKPGFTIEVGVGTNPLPFRAYGEIWSNNVLLALEGLRL